MPTEACIAGQVDLPHATLPDGPEDVVRTQPGSRCEFRLCERLRHIEGHVEKGADLRVMTQERRHFCAQGRVAPALRVERPFEVLARSTVTIELASLQSSGTYASALVELMGEGGFVEQAAESPWGRSASGCSNSTSTKWYFADNYTFGASTEDLVITNPFPDEAILDFTFASDEGVWSEQYTTARSSGPPSFASRAVAMAVRLAMEPPLTRIPPAPSG